MITNSDVTIFHKTISEETHQDLWEKLYFEKVWFFGGKGAGINKGYDNANDVEIRIPYEFNQIDASKFKVGDIIIKGNVDWENGIEAKGFEIYHITSIKNNNFGTQPHVHIGGK